MLDSDLARIYGTPTGALNRAVRRNRERFPADFMFQISPTEWKKLEVPNWHFKFVLIEGVAVAALMCSLKRRDYGSKRIE